MTGQVSDKFFYNNNAYSIVAIDNPICFYPQDYGITPEAVCTACWAGYWCEYDISDSGIMLKNLFINSADGNYPPINGITPEASLKIDGVHVNMGHHAYKDICLKLEYTGRILVGRDFLPDYYIHMGFQRAWAYSTLTELVFENGALVDTIDHSITAAEIRDKLDERGGRRDEDIRAYIEECFSLEMGIKAWWIKPDEDNK